MVKTGTGTIIFTLIVPVPISFLATIEQDVPTLDYIMIESAHALKAVEPLLTYPVVMKATIGSMGRNVSLVTDNDMLYAQYEHLGPRVIVQEYVPVDHDYRVLVIGGKAIGAYRRHRTDGDFRMNRPGNKKEAVTLGSSVIDLCERAARLQNIEIAGIDLIKKDGSWHVLEINTSPAFNQFEQVTGINVAKHILEYAREQVEKNSGLRR